ncbi:MAG: M48 family metallopeptidase [Desulfobacter sp.]|nr:M48 family metallopeptidase [Desulfobacter sp.]
MKLQGFFFDGKTARARPSTLVFNQGRITVQTDSKTDFILDCPIEDALFVPQLGQTRRIIKFSQGQRFETEDHPAVQQIEYDQGLNRTFFLIHFFETQWKTVLVCLLGLGILIAGLITQGLPLIATHIADKLPRDILDKTSLKAQTLIQEQMLKPSGLDPEKIKEIQTLFNALVRDMETKESDFSFSLHFGQSRAIGANAFALPSGTIFITDSLVTMAENTREIQGILIHEITHVTQRHALRNLIQNTGLFVIISLVAGDGASITGLAVSLPALLLESGYSQQFQLDADAGVALYFKKNGWDIHPFEKILTRLTQHDPNLPGHSFISTHPRIDQRISNLRQIMSAETPLEQH